MKIYFKDNLTFLRKKLNKTQSDIATQVNKSQRIVSNWERDNTEPSLEEIGILSKFLGVSSDDLLFKNLPGSENDSTASIEVSPLGQKTSGLTPTELMETTIATLKSAIEDKSAIITLLKSENDRLKAELKKRK